MELGGDQIDPGMYSVVESWSIVDRGKESKTSLACSKDLVDRKLSLLFPAKIQDSCSSQAVTCNSVLLSEG